ncbi:MAG: flagellar export chaperone FliS [Phycisphaerales bacterium]|nr:flagellar export chaperone FliS [Phycisphaerales bacterium]
MAFDINNPYFRTKVLTASPEQLRLYLLDGALHFMNEGRQAMVERNYEAVYDNFKQGKAIILELMNSLRPEIDPELCQRLSSIYTFVYTELTQGSFEKDIERIDNAIELMEYDRETWVMLLERIKEENGGSGSAAAAAAPTTPGAVPTGSTISFEG